MKHIQVLSRQHPATAAVQSLVGLIDAIGVLLGFPSILFGNLGSGVSVFNGFVDALNDLFGGAFFLFFFGGNNN